MIMKADTLFDRMSVLADPVRSRILLVLERNELTVSELCTVFQLPQSTMSRQLKLLSDEGLLVSRAEATSRRYSMPLQRLEPAARRLWQVVREQVAVLDATEQDAQRLRSVVADRKVKSQEFFSTSAGEWDRVRRELFGRSTDLQAMLGLLDEGWVFGDLGCGTGQLSAAIAPFVRRVIAIDDSPAMLAAARSRLERAPNVEVRGGEVESLPVEDGELDAAMLMLVLHFVPEPLRALSEAARVLKPGGRLLVVDMSPHDREEYRQRMGHVWLGFTEDQLSGWSAEAGFHRFRHAQLPADPEAKGPTLVTASMSRKR